MALKDMKFEAGEIIDAGKDKSGIIHGNAIPQTGTGSKLEFRKPGEPEFIFDAKK